MRPPSVWIVSEGSLGNEMLHRLLPDFRAVWLRGIYKSREQAVVVAGSIAQASGCLRGGADAGYWDNGEEGKHPTRFVSVLPEPIR